MSGQRFETTQMLSDSFRRHYAWADAPICLTDRWWQSEVQNVSTWFVFLFLDHGASVCCDSPPRDSRFVKTLKEIGFMICSQWPPLFPGATAALQSPISLSLLSLWVQVPGINFHTSFSLAASKPPNNSVSGELFCNFETAKSSCLQAKDTANVCKRKCNQQLLSFLQSTLSKQRDILFNLLSENRAQLPEDRFVVSLQSQSTLCCLGANV